jgi:peptidyl-prolyl cis-trans isomerase D
MLAKLRENSRSVIVWVLFGIIIAFFIISFGPQSDQITCSSRDNHVVDLPAGQISERSWRFAMNGLGFGSGGGERARLARAKETVVDGLIERALLVEFAREAGMRVTEEQTAERIAAGDAFILGRALPPNIYIDDNKAFDFEALERFSSSLGLYLVRYFIEEQQLEHMANLGRTLLMQSSRVAPDEVEARYRHQNTTVAIDFVKFKQSDYAAALNLSQADLEQYLQAFEAEVKKKYEADERTYKGVSAQVKVRHLFVKRDKTSPVVAGSGDAGPQASPDPTLDPGHARAVAARERIVNGADFAAIAQEVSEDPATRGKGGHLGWRTETALGLGPEVAAAVKGLKPGDLSQVIVSPRGFHIMKIEDRREGDLSYDQVKYEIAEALALTYYADAAARRDAQAALAKLLASGKGLASAFERQDASQPSGALPSIPGGFPGHDDIPGGPGVIQLPAPPGVDDGSDEPAGDGEGGHGKQGHRLIEGRFVPTAFQVDDGQMPAASAGSGAAADAPPKLDIPKLVDLHRPKMMSSGSMTRSNGLLAGPGMKPYIGQSEELTEILFDKLEPGQLADKAYNVGDGYVLAQLTERKQPDMQKFAEERQSMTLSMQREKGQQVLDSWVRDQCQQAVKQGEIAVERRFVEYNDPETGDPLPATYQPCSTL